MADTLAAALWLAQRGMHVFELDHPELPKCAGVRTREHDPDSCAERGKHPACKWSQAATTDREAVTAMFTGNPRNIGVACGPSGLVVIDEDVPGDFARFCESIGQAVPDTFRVRTGKGWHYYFHQPEGVDLTNQEGALRGYGVNVRGVGGYVVGPGSVHATDATYQPDNPDAEILPAPAWLVTALTGQSGTDSPFAQPDQPKDHTWWRDAEVIHHPNRHEALVSAAGYCRKVGMSRDGAVPTIRDVWRRCCPGTCCRDEQGKPVKAYAFEQALAKLDDIYERYEAGDPVDNSPFLADSDQRPALEFTSLADLCAKVDADGPRRYLIRGIWPASAYGVHAAEMKAQKTWNTLDLAVSVASGTPWLGAFPIDNPGPVVIFVGEGGEGGTVRRIRAICDSRNLKAEELPITICMRAPHLKIDAHLAAFRDHVETIRPSLVLLDPLYLSMGGADGKDLYAMGQVLERPQRICDELGASFMVVTHFNRGGRTGAGRITGAGPAEWGRVLIGAEVKGRHTDPASKATTVIAVVDVIGGEVPDQSFRVKRIISADDPDDLDSPLRYAVEVGDDEPAETPDREMPPARRKLLEALQAADGARTVSELVDWIAGKYGHGLKRNTCSEHLNALMRDGFADQIDRGDGGPKLWLAVGVGGVATPSHDTSQVGVVGVAHLSDTDTYDTSSDTSLNKHLATPPAAEDVPICGCGTALDQHAAHGCDAPVVHRPADLWSTP